MQFLPRQSPPFYGAHTEAPIPGAVTLIGVAYDGMSSFRDGSRWGPDAIRTVSFEGIEGYSPVQDRDLDQFPLADLGNLKIDPTSPEQVIEAVHQATQALLQEGAIPLILGGDHSLSPAAIRAAFERHPDLGVIQFDAHADLRDTWDDSPHSHACTMRRVLDFLPSEQLLQVGIRSGSREEFSELHRESRLVQPTPESLQTALDAYGFDKRPLYITFDVDVFDPSVLPGTGTPETGGIDWPTFERLQATLPCDQVVAMDIVELSPDLDPTGNSAILGTKRLREWILAISPGHR